MVLGCSLVLMLYTITRLSARSRVASPESFVNRVVPTSTERNTLCLSYYGIRFWDNKGDLEAIFLFR